MKIGTHIEYAGMHCEITDINGKILTIANHYGFKSCVWDNEVTEIKEDEECLVCGSILYARGELVINSKHFKSI